MAVKPSPVTVVIPVHNGAATIRRAINSALTDASTIVVVNDASTDGTPDILLEYADNPKVYPMSTPSSFPSGVCVARNIGIDFAKPGLIIPLDADDEFVPGGIRAMCTAFRPETFVVPGWLENGKHLTPPPIGMLHKKAVGFATICFHKEDWKRAGGYDPDFNMGAEDWAFMLALRKINVSATLIFEIAYKRCNGGGGRTRAAIHRSKAINLLVKEKFHVK